MGNYRLFMTLRSPFARRIRIAFKRLEIPVDMEEVDPFNPHDRFLDANPLGLVPVMITSSGESFPDSGMILEHLDETHGRKIWPEDPTLRLRVRHASTLAEGIMSATVNFFLETQRRHPSPEWAEDHTSSIHRTLRAIEKSDPQGTLWLNAGKPTQAGWDLGVALEYLDLRAPALSWRDKYKAVAPVLEICNKFDYFRQSTPPPPGA